MTEAELTKLHALELDIALTIREICEKHHIRYFLLAGSVLGAIRHQGFIPWDEDMDIGMLRGDYETFLAACREDLDNEKYFLQTTDTDRHYALPFAKIRLNGTKIVEMFSREVSCHQGIFVDIFPMDAVPDDPAQQKKQYRQRWLWKNLFSRKNGYEVGVGKNPVKRAVLNLAAGILPYSYLHRKRDEAYRLYSDQPSGQVVTAAGSYGYWKEIIPRRYTEQLTDQPFEGQSFPVFDEYEAYLTGMYGDYMQLPDPADRYKHEVEEIDFGPYA